MREIRTYGSEGGEAETNRPSLPLSPIMYLPVTEALLQKDAGVFGKASS